jgi:hypothetical protein
MNDRGRPRARCFFDFLHFGGHIFFFASACCNNPTEMGLQQDFVNKETKIPRIYPIDIGNNNKRNG